MLKQYLRLAAIAIGLAIALNFSNSFAEDGVAKPKVLLFFGVYTQWYKFDQILKKDYEMKTVNARTDRVESFPSPNELSSYSIIILSDVTADSLTPAWIKWLDQYVKKGGSLLVTGGPFTYGEGNFKEKGIDAILPVETAKFDLKWEKAGVAIKIDNAVSPIVEGVDIKAEPMVYWIHQLIPKQGMEVIMSAGKYPLVIAGKYGEGKVIVFTGSPLGLPLEKQVPFWEWPGWEKLTGNCCNWLANKSISK